MILYFVRHGKAGHHTASQDDDERQLTDAGVDALRAAAPLWQRLNLRPDIVLSSPLPRALVTARLVMEGIGLAGNPVREDRLRPGARWEDLARAMAGHPDARRVMFVGHEPDLSNAVCLLSGASSVRMRKGGIACVEFPGIPEPGAGELAWLLDPDLYDPAAETVSQLTRVAGYALCLDDAGRILLARLTFPEIAAGQWTLPGGGIDFGEAPGEAVLRELTEETGLTGEVLSLAHVGSWVRLGPAAPGHADEYQAIQIIYRVRVTGGELSNEVDGSTDAAAWFTREEVAELPIVGLVEQGLRILDQAGAKPA